MDQAAQRPGMPPAGLVWRRDTSASSRTWTYWVAGGIAALAAFGVFAGYMADDPGSAASIGGLGAIAAGLFLVIPRVFDRGRRMHPEIHLDGGRLRWAKVEVPVDQVVSWGTAIRTSQVSNGTTVMRMTSGFAEFRLADGSTKSFTFPHLAEPERQSMESALARTIPIPAS